MCTSKFRNRQITSPNSVCKRFSHQFDTLRRKEEKADENDDWRKGAQKLVNRKQKRMTDNMLNCMLASHPLLQLLQRVPITYGCHNWIIPREQKDASSHFQVMKSPIFELQVNSHPVFFLTVASPALWP